MAFPVTSFYVYHQVDWFKDSIEELQRKLINKETIESRKEINECLDIMKSKRDKVYKKQMEKLQQENEQN